jgi:hypothetical protein
LTLDATCSFDYPKDRVNGVDDAEIQWSSETRGDWDGLRVRPENRSAELSLQLGDYRAAVAGAELPLGVTRRVLGPSDTLVVVKGRPRSGDAAFQVTDRTILYRRNYYYLRILQADGEMAWSSPVWVTRAEQ